MSGDRRMDAGTDGVGIADYYAERAPEYDRIYDRPERQVDLARLRDIVRSFGRGRRVLEVACGTGYWTQFLAADAKSVVATDVGDAVLAIARSRRLPPGRVTFERADAFALDGVPGDYDAAFAGFWWSHLAREAIPRFLDGLHARLGGAGSVLFVDNLFVEGSSTPIRRTDPQGNTYQLRTLATGRTFEVLKNFPTPEELRRQLSSRGARAIAVSPLEYYWTVRYEVSDPAKESPSCP